MSKLFALAARIGAGCATVVAVAVVGGCMYLVGKLVVHVLRLAIDDIRKTSVELKEETKVQAAAAFETAKVKTKQATSYVRTKATQAKEVVVSFFRAVGSRVVSAFNNVIDGVAFTVGTAAGQHLVKRVSRRFA